MKEVGLKFRLAVCLLALAAVAAAQPEDFRITVGKSVVIDYPTDIARISTSNPEIVDAVAVTTREVLLHGKSIGTASLVVWSKSGQRSFYNATVEHNLEPIRKILKETFPGEDIRVQAARDTVALTGKVSAKDVSDKAAALVAPLAKTVLNNLQVAPGPVETQILLRVRFAEINRTSADALGVNLISTGALNTPGAVTTGQFASPRAQELQGSIPGAIAGTSSKFTISDALNIFAFRPDLNLAAFIKAMQNKGLLQILAEPNLVTVAGKEASFLVGGEFPVPVVQGGATAGAVTIMFREFGIRLSFTPVLTAHKTIKMHVKPEVSTIDLANAVQFQGTLIPALSTRRMETNIELGEGQSFIIAGLLDDRATENLARIPGLSSIPVLGALFRSRQESKQQTELVVMVTPETAAPLNPGDPKPMPHMPKEFLPHTSSAVQPPAQPGTAERAALGQPAPDGK